MKALTPLIFVGVGKCVIAFIFFLGGVSPLFDTLWPNNSISVPNITHLLVFSFNLASSSLLSISSNLPNATSKSFQ